MAVMINEKDLHTIITTGGGRGRREAGQSLLKGMRISLFIQPGEISIPKKQVELDNPQIRKDRKVILDSSFLLKAYIQLVTNFY